MEKTRHLGMNRTGIDMSPIDSEAMIEGTKLARMEPVRYDDVNAIRQAYVEKGESFGSVPIPGTMKGFLKSGMEKLSGRNPEILINKLGQRLAFERTGVRLYEAFIQKCELSNDAVAMKVISIPELKHFRDEEAEHFMLVKDAMTKLGADPTAQTPDADAAALASMGIPKVLTEPRTSISQCLEAILTTELTDNAAWGLLHELCLKMGMDDMANSFSRALSQEEVHAARIKEWLKQIVMTQGQAQGAEPTRH